MINLITLAGDGLRFSKHGIKIPKPMIHIDGEPMVFRAVDCLPKAEKYVFVCRQSHIDKFNIDLLLKNRYHGAEIIAINETTEGQACTAEVGIHNSSISDNDEILISCCDYGLSWSVDSFDEIKRDSDIVIWSTIRNGSFSKNPSSYSWLVTNGSKFQKVYVKEHIFNDSYNNRAIVGTFYFRKAKYFLNSVNTIYKQNIRSNNEFYIDNIFNTIDKLRVNVFDVDDYTCWGTPEDLGNYENKIL
jgi:NDP-sugar pyrophosphorylase family protein